MKIENITYYQLLITNKLHLSIPMGRENGFKPRKVPVRIWGEVQNMSDK